MTDATVTFDLLTALGVPFDATRTKVWLTFNTDEGWIVDATGAVRMDAGTATITSAGLVTITGIPVPSGSTNPTDFQVKVHFDAPVVLPGVRSLKRKTGDFGWMTVTADADLTDLIAEQYVPPTWLTTAQALLQGYVDEGADLLAAQIALSEIGTSDSLVSALILGTAGAGPLTRSALSASTEAAIEDQAVVQRPAIRAAQPVVCFTFDDCPIEDTTVVKPILDAAGIKGGFAFPSAYPGLAGLMSWAQIKALYDDGHGMLAHSLNHTSLVGLSTADKTAQINNRSVYESHGLTVRGIAYPNGAHDAEVRKISRDFYDYGLGTVTGTSGSQGPLSTYAIRRIAIKDSTVTATHYAQIDTAITNGEILVFIIHANPTAAEFTSAGGGYARLADVIAYAQAHDVPILTPDQAFDLVKNTLDTGDYPSGASYSVIDGAGSPHIPNVSTPLVFHTADSTSAIGRLPSAYSEGVTVQVVSSVASPAAPNAGIGTLRTTIPNPGVSATAGQVNFQEFIGSNGTGYWMRNATSDNSGWWGWTRVDIISNVVPWTASLATLAYQRVQLPTGGFGYMTATRTTRSTFDATERDFWTFIPGGHVEQVAAGTTTWKAPTGITKIRSMDLLAGGAGGCGGGSATTAINQVGGPGGSCGERVVRRNLTVVAGTSYTTSVGTGGAGGAGGAASGNNPGIVGVKGNDTTIVIGSTTYRAWSGNPGTAPASGTTTANGSNSGNVAWSVGTSGVPGAGGQAASNFGNPPAPLAGAIGGAGGGPASSATSKGGLGGGARTAPNTGIASVAGGGSATADGGNGTTATEPGCGGGGGGGGCANGAGGTGGAGADGLLVIEF